MELLYLTDPMCAWCWGFAPVLDRLTRELKDSVPLHYIVGGLAPDSDAPMPGPIRQMVQGAWDSVEAATGVQFNRDFWAKCQPRRSTYPACRAVLAAESLQEALGPKMVRAIQHAYYQDARNPSDVDVLVHLATALQLDASEFRDALLSPAIETRLQEHIATRAHLGATADASGFPSLILRTGTHNMPLTRGYCSWEELEPKLRQAQVLRSSV